MVSLKVVGLAVADINLVLIQSAQTAFVLHWEQQVVIWADSRSQTRQKYHSFETICQHWPWNPAKVVSILKSSLRRECQKFQLTF